MEPLFTYLIQASLSLTLFYLCFLLFFRSQPYFSFNRYYLLFTLLLSALLPLFSFNLPDLFSSSTGNYAAVQISRNISSYQLNEIIVGKPAQPDNSQMGASLPLIIYAAGLTLLLVRLIFRFIQLSLMASKYRKEKHGNLVFVVTEKGSPTFSFMNRIYLSPEVYHDKRQFLSIIQHEQAHTANYHSADLILSELVIIIQWFNPFAYLLKKLIKENHEYLADRKVLRGGFSRATYSSLLMEHSTILMTNSLAHNFSYSLLKRRLQMMKKPKKPIRFLMGNVIVLIMAFIAAIACSRPDTQSDQLEEGILRNSQNEATYSEVEQMPQYPGGMDSLVAFLTKNIRYPETAKQNNVSGKVMVEFVIETDGTVTEVKLLKGIGSGCDEEAMRVVREMSSWIPGKKDGQAVRVSYVLPIAFTLDQSESKDEVFTVVEQMPQYIGGREAMFRYLTENIKYPEAAKRDSVSGTVFVSFVVEKDGRVSDVDLLRGIGSGCDEEALRVVSEMPEWKPGKHEGENVRVKYNLPIRFALQ